MIARVAVAREAVQAALRVRRQLGIDVRSPLCAFDVAEALGIEVWFQAHPSIEGMYCQSNPPRIVVTSLRPMPRRRMTCAHEIGHHVFAHGTRIDELLIEGPAANERDDPQEVLADAFGAELLAPKLAVLNAFVQRQWEARRCSPREVYIAAGVLGVGYSTLITHMTWFLKIIRPEHAADLLKTTKAAIREELMGIPTRANVLVVDEHWPSRPIDLEVGDILVSTTRVAATGSALAPRKRTALGQCFEANRPGLAQLASDATNRSHFVRVSRREYVGWSKYRHLEDPDDDN